MVVVKKTRNGAYRLAKLDGAVSRLCFAAFRLVPYLARSRSVISVTHLLDPDDLEALNVADEASEGADEDPLTEDGQNFDPPGGVTPTNSLSLKPSFLARFGPFGYPRSQLPILRYRLIFSSSRLVRLMSYSRSPPFR